MTFCLMRIVLTAGGTGGHLYPLLAVASELKKIVGEKDDVEFLFLGPKGELEKEVMDKEFIPSKLVLSGKFRRYFSLQNFIDLFKIPIGIIQSLWHLLIFMPDVVFAKGGYATVPVVISAWIYRIPVIIHESDVMPGIANRFLSKMAKRVAISFPAAFNFFPKEKTVLTGIPIRRELIGGDKEKAKELFHLSLGKEVILVVGGSQGSRVINQAIVNALPSLLHRFEIIHITGKNEYEPVIHEAARVGIKAGRRGYHPYPFLKEELPHAFKVADLVISRAGASLIAEIAANGKPSILVPLKTAANNHQQANAFSVAQAGAAVMLEQDNLGENILMEKVKEILDNKEERYEISERIKKFYNSQAAEKIAEEILGLAGVV